MTRKTAKAKRVAPKAKKAPLADKVEVRTPNKPGYVGRVDAAKYAATKKALLKVLPRKAPGLTQGEMGAAVAPHLPADLRAKAMWWAKCVQLDLEAAGEVVRDATKPLTWRKV